MVFELINNHRAMFLKVVNSSSTILKVKLMFSNFGNIFQAVETEVPRDLQQYLYMPVRLHEESQKQPVLGKMIFF